MSRTLTDYLINNRYTRPVRVGIERRAINFNSARQTINRLYNTTGLSGKSTFYQRSAKIFRDYQGVFRSGEWALNAPPFSLTMPLRKDWAWLDWDLALSALGHEPEIKDFYMKLLASPFRPSIFCDIGANYGVHTALFLSAGIPSIAFEPNPSCCAYFETFASLNRFPGVIWHHVALGESNGNARLDFPEKDTWLGTVRPNGSGCTENGTSLEVEVKRLDDVEIPCGKCFAKIDTEGAELAVVRGGRCFFRERCDFFVFESNPGSERAALFAEIAGLGFLVEPLPIHDIHESAPLTQAAFETAPGTNFLARGETLAGL